MKRSPPSGRSPPANRRHTLHVWGLAAVLAAFLSIMGHLLWAGYWDALRSAEKTTMGLANLYESHLDASLRRADAVLLDMSQGLSGAYEIMARGNLARAAIGSLVEEHLIGFDEVTGIYMVDAKGLLRYASDSSLVGIDLADRDYFRMLRDDPAPRLFVSAVLTARTTGKATVMLARPVLGKRGQFLGVVGLTLNLGFLEKLLTRTSVVPNGLLSIRRIEDGRPVVQNYASGEAANTVIEYSLIQKMIDAGEAQGNVTESGLIGDGGRILSFRKVAGYPWIVVVGILKHDATADWQRRVYAILAILVVMGGGALVLILALGRAHREIFDVAGEMRKLSLAVEQNPNSVVITDLAGNIEYVNRGFSSNTGYAAEEVIGRNAGLLKSGLTPPATFEDLWQNLKQGRSWKGEFINRSRTGELQTNFVHVLPIRQSDGTISNYVSIQEDITEKKRQGEELNRYRHHLEDVVKERTGQLQEAHAVLSKHHAEITTLNEALEQRARDLEAATIVAESANRSKSTFLSNMSHEIRTPMNAIIGLTYLLRREVRGNKPSDYLNKISAAARHLLGIINDILDISKIEAGKLTLEHTDLNLQAVFGNVTSLIGQKAKDKGLELDYSIDSRLSGILQGDPLRLEQVLLNFASNAVKFTEHGAIRMRASLLEQLGERVVIRFEVEDHGIGIAPADQARLFAVFEQADGSTTRKYGGTGLGLAICRRLAQLMQGEAGVNSAPGRGSLFWFTASLGCAAEIHRPSDKHAGHGSPADAEFILQRDYRGSRILLAEDNLVNQEVIGEFLRDLGFVVDNANNGAIAVELAAQFKHDLILMDMQMPEMSGIEATRVIRRLPGRHCVPIVALTANAFDEDRERCLAAGMDDFLGKPVEPELFFATLLRWLAAEQRPAPITEREPVSAPA